MGVNENIAEGWNLSTLSDGKFGTVKEFYYNDTLFGIYIYGYFDEDTEITEDVLLKYLVNQFNIENIRELENEEELIVWEIQKLYYLT